MQRHLKSLSLQQEACGAIVHMCLDPINRQVGQGESAHQSGRHLTDAVQLFARENVLERISDTMRTHLTDCRLQNHCVGAMLNLTIDGTGAEHALLRPARVADTSGR